MKYHGAPCFICMEKTPEVFREAKPEQLAEIKLYAVELRDDLLFDLTCPHGHKSAFFLQQRKFEVLFDLGVMALLDGYSREAVSSFAAAVERLYEYAIRCFLLVGGVDPKAFADTWKHVSNQSERQLGGYAFLYLFNMKRPPAIVPGDRVNFRNKAIHKGYIPNAEEAREYGECIYNYMIGVVKDLKAFSEKAMREVDNEDMNTLVKTAEKEGKRPVSLAVGTLLNVDGEMGKDSFADGLKRFIARRWLNP